MPGELVPLVLVPRYTTYCGDAAYVTIGMDVTQYQTAILQVWRGAMLGGTPTIAVTCEESSDQDNWTTCTGTNVSGFDPGLNLEGQVEATLTKRWFRLKIVLGGADNVVTCWVVGFLEERLS